MKHEEYFAARNWQMINRVDGKQSYCDFDLKKLSIKLPAFHEECLKFLVKCSAVNNLNIQDLNGKDLSKVILWNNKFICIGDKSEYFRNLA